MNDGCTCVYTHCLAPGVLNGLLARVERLTWKDGRETARGAAADVKHCQVAQLHDPALLDEEGSQLVAAVYSFVMTELRGFALPARFGGMRFVRYREGDSYGWHVDDAFDPNTGFRCDLSFTLVLQEPKAGGTLAVGDGGPGDGESWELRRNWCLVYPATLPHCVTPVLSGERIVIVGWLQSMVRDPGKRALLAELDRMATNPNERQSTDLRAVRNELLRRWCG